MAPKFLAHLFGCTKSPSPPERSRSSEKVTISAPFGGTKITSDTSSQTTATAIEENPNDSGPALAEKASGATELVVVPLANKAAPKAKAKAVKAAAPPAGKPSLVSRAAPLPKPAKQQAKVNIIPDQHRRRDIGVRTYNPIYNQGSDPYYGFIPMSSSGGDCAGAPPSSSSHHHHSSCGSGSGSGSACGSSSGGGSSCGGGSSSCGSSSSCGGGGSSCGSS